MTRRRVLWLFLFLLLLIVPALLPPSTTYDPTLLVAGLAESVKPVTPGLLSRPGSLTVTNVKLPGTQAPTSIRIESGRITRIGGEVGTDLPILDGNGRYVMPGLFDAHVHLSLAPGAALRGDDAQQSADLRAWHLRAYLASGVTSILDPAVDDRIAIEVRARLSAGHVGPRYFALGPPVAARAGYIDDLFPPGFSDGDTDRLGSHLDKLVNMGASGVKVPLEPGMLAPIWKVHSPKMREEIRRQAAERKLPIYVHAISDAMYRLGLELSPHAFVHPPETIEEPTLKRLMDAHIFVMSTLAVYDTQRFLLHPEVFADAQGLLTIPPIELETLRSPAMQRRYLVDMIGENLPFVKGRYRDLFARFAATDFGQSLMLSALEPRLSLTASTVRKLHRAGVPIVLGSDAGNWPVFPFFFHGPTTWREVALLEKAGLSPAETLQAATMNPARMLGIEKELGSVEVGKRADLLLLDSDPLQGVARALPTLHTVIFDGIARTKEEWMKRSP